PVEIVETAVDVAALVEGRPFVTEPVPHLGVVIEVQHSGATDETEELRALDPPQHLERGLVIESAEVAVRELIEGEQALDESHPEPGLLVGGDDESVRSALVGAVGKISMRKCHTQDADEG